MLQQMTVKVEKKTYVVQYSIEPRFAKKECVECDRPKKVIWYEVTIVRVSKGASARNDIPEELANRIKLEICLAEGLFEMPRCMYHAERWRKDNQI